MKKTKVVDRFGNHYTKSATMPNLDPSFWLFSHGSSGVDVKDVMTKPFAHHVWVYSCVRAIYRNVCQITRVLQNSNTNAVKEKHAVIDLLNKPNDMMTGKQFIQTVICYLLLPTERTNGGQCFIVPWNTAKDDKVRLDKGEIPSELMPFSDQYFKPKYVKQNYAARKGMKVCNGWIYEIPGKMKIEFEHSEIIRINLMNPYDLLTGMSPFTPAYMAVKTDAQADLYNQNIFENNGRLDGAVSTDQMLEREDLELIKSEWYKQYTGPKKKRTAFLSGGMKYEQYALSTTEMQYIEQEKWTRSKELGVYGLNRVAIGDYEDINFATIREAKKMLWHDNYIPTDGILLDAFNYQWIHNIENGAYELVSDYSKIPALSNDMKERAVIAGELTTKVGMPASLACRTAGILLHEDDLKKYPWLDEQLKKATPFQSESVPDKMVSKSVDPKYSDNYIKTVLAPVEKKFKIALDKYFIAQRNSILDAIDAASKEKSIDKEITLNAWEFIPDDVLETMKMTKLYKEATKMQAAMEKKQVENEFGHDIEWDADGTRIDYWVSIRSGYLRDINTTTFTIAREAIIETVQTGLDEGITVNEMTKRVKKAVHAVYEVRLGHAPVPHGDFDLGGMSSSKTIARTEMGSVASMTRNDIFKQEGVKEIRWITSNDEKVRPSHSMVNGQKIIYGDRFDNGLRFPRDPNGSGGEVINCRCSFIAVFDDGENEEE